MNGEPLATPETLLVVGAAIVEKGLCLVAQRSSAMALPGKWEFPGGKVHPGESPRAALAREIAEELGLTVEVGARIGVGFDDQGPRRIRLEVYRCTIRGGALQLAEHAAVRWLGPEELEPLDWAEADLPVLPALRAVLLACR